MIQVLCDGKDCGAEVKHGEKAGDLSYIDIKVTPQMEKIGHKITLNLCGKCVDKAIQCIQPKKN